MTTNMKELKKLRDGARQAIVTKFLGPTNTRGSRITASCDAGRITIGCDDSLDVAENHAAAALALFHKLGWHERNSLVMGGTAAGYVFVQVPKR